MNKPAGYLFILAGIIGVAPYIGNQQPNTAANYLLALIYVVIGISFLIPFKNKKRDG